MAGLDDRAHASRPDRVLNGLRDLLREPFLNLQAAGEYFDHAGHLAQSG
jgi:hypothetical protein